MFTTVLPVMPRYTSPLPSSTADVDGLHVSPLHSSNQSPQSSVLIAISFAVFDAIPGMNAVSVI